MEMWTEYILEELLKCAVSCNGQENTMNTRVANHIISKKKNKSVQQLTEVTSQPQSNL